MSEDKELLAHISAGWRFVSWVLFCSGTERVWFGFRVWVLVFQQLYFILQTALWRETAAVRKGRKQQKGEQDKQVERSHARNQLFKIHLISFEAEIGRFLLLRQHHVETEP